MESRTANSKRNILFGVISGLLVPLFGFIVRTAIAKYLGEMYLGLTGFMTSVLQVLNLAELGFSSAVIVNLYKPLSDNDYITVRAILAFFRKAYCIIGIVISVVGIGIMPILPLMLGSTSGIRENIYIVYIIYVLNTVISYYLFGYKEALLVALQRFDITKKAFSLVLIIRSILQVLSVVIFKSFYYFALVLCLATIAYNLVLHYITKKSCPQYFPEGELDDSLKNKIKGNIMGLSINKVLDVARNSLDSIFLTFYLGLTIGGIYSNYYFVYTTLINLMWILVSAIQASVGNSIATESIEKNHADFIKFEFIFNAIITAVTVYLLVLYQPFMRIWMGDEMLLSNYNMTLFSVYFYSMAMNGIRNAYYNALGLWWKARRIVLVEAGSNLVLNIVLGKLFGVTGILLATLFTMVFINYIGISNLVYREYFKKGIGKFYLNRVRYTIIMVLVSICSYCVCEYFGLEGVLGLIGRIVICTVFLVTVFPILLLIVEKDLFKESIHFIKGVFKV